MNKKKKKDKPCQNCIDCNNSMDDYYPVFSNRGTVYRCVECYELWLTRSTRIISVNSKDIEASTEFRNRAL
jgi:hypothetical protein